MPTKSEITDSSSLGDTRSFNVLVCEDDLDTRALIVATLGSKQINVLEASNGALARDICTKKRPDLIVLDIMLPEMDGLQFLAWWREYLGDRFAPVLLLTALSSAEDKVRGLEAGADDYLPKPFHPSELRARVDTLLRAKYLTEKLEQQNLALLEANHELRTTREKLVQQERQLAAMQLAGAALHELGQPVTSIKLFLHQLHSLERGKANGSFSGVLGQIENECSRLEKILERLKCVDASRVSSYVGETSVLSLDDISSSGSEETEDQK